MLARRDDPDRVIVFATALTEPEGAMIANWLREGGVQAQSEGGFTAGFRAAAPGLVRILVRQGDIERARRILAQMDDDDDGGPGDRSDTAT